MDLRAARTANGLSQVRAAVRLGVSQSYLAMLESGRRRLTLDLARRAMKVYGVSPDLLPLSDEESSLRTSGDPARLARDVAALGYPGFAHSRPRRWTARNPTEVFLSALAQEGLEARMVEALPWLMLRHWPLDRGWLIRQAKLQDLQNRLGFVATLARRLAERAGDAEKVRDLSDFETKLERSRLAREDALSGGSLSEAERRWLRDHMSDDARRWNVLTDWTVDALRYTS